MRRVCTHCARVRDVREYEKGALPWLSDIEVVCEPVGCEQCFQVGYRGRIGLFEVLLYDDALKELVSCNSSGRA